MLTKAQQLANRYFLACKDMEDAERYLKACQELDELQRNRGNSFYFDHCEGLLCAAIIAYCRPFKRNKSADFADKLLRPEQVSVLADFAKLHELLSEKRDTFIAHADWSARSTQILKIEENGIVFRQAPLPSPQKGIDLKEFMDLVDEVKRECRWRTYELDTGQAAEG